MMKSPHTSRVVVGCATKAMVSERRMCYRKESIPEDATHVLLLWGRSFPTGSVQSRYNDGLDREHGWTFVSETWVGRPRCAFERHNSLGVSTEVEGPSRLSTLMKIYDDEFTEEEYIEQMEREGEKLEEDMRSGVEGAEGYEDYVRLYDAQEALGKEMEIERLQNQYPQSPPQEIGSSDEHENQFFR